MTAPNYKITFRNNSKIVTDDKVYLVVKGQNPDNCSGEGTTPDGQTHNFSTIESYLHVTDGVGTWVRVDEATKAGKTSEDFAVALTDLTGSVLRVPPSKGARIYISFDHKMHFVETVGYKPGHIPDTLSIGEPDPCDTSDVNYYAIYDKIEYTYVYDGPDSKNNGVWIDTTAVDFFCMSLTLTAIARVDKPDGGHEEKEETVGLAQTQAAVYQAFKTAFDSAGGDWPNLALMYKDTDPLRVAAPNKAAHAAKPFTTTYLDPLIAALWEAYQTRSLTVDCSGLSSPPDPPHLTGQVTGSGAGAKFTFSNGQQAKKPATVTLDGLPTSNQVLGCGQGIMEAQNDTPQSVVVRTLGAGMNVGVLPVAAAGAVVNKAFFKGLAAKGDFYNSQAPHASGYTPPTGGPWYNVYAGALHSFGDKVYAFAFDDAVGQDSTLMIDDFSHGTTCEIGDMTGTTIPKTSDDRKYTCYFAVGAECTMTLNRQTYQPGTHEIADLASVFTLSYTIGDNDPVDVTVYCLLQQATLAGTKITEHEPNPVDTVLDVGLPGAPSQQAISHQTGDHRYKITFVPGGNCSGTWNGGPMSATNTSSNSPPQISFAYTTPKAVDPVNYSMDIEKGSWSPAFPENTNPTVQQLHPEDWAEVFIALPGY